MQTCNRFDLVYLFDKTPLRITQVLIPGALYLAEDEQGLSQMVQAGALRPEDYFLMPSRINYKRLSAFIDKWNAYLFLHGDNIPYSRRYDIQARITRVGGIRSQWVSEGVAK